MKIIIGLGNPGDNYKNTRHNAGFMLLDRIKKAYAFPDFKLEKRFQAEISRHKSELSGNNDIILVKPQTFMNESGSSVRKILDFYKKITPDDLVVIHDDIDIKIGEYKISDDASSAGHNGVQSIIDAIGTKSFKRIRIGTANENLRTKIDPSDFVLGQFTESESGVILDDVSGNILHEIGKLL
jgi:peptidyl-tRNA hydrolase, PTH1 family